MLLSRFCAAFVPPANRCKSSLCLGAALSAPAEAGILCPIERFSCHLVDGRMIALNRADCRLTEGWARWERRTPNNSPRISWGDLFCLQTMIINARIRAY